MSEEQINEMIKSYARLEEIRTVELNVSRFHMEMASKMLEVQEHRNDILVEILSVLKGEK